MFNEVFNLCCDLELEHSEAMFSQDSLPYDVPSEKWKQKDQQFSHTKSGYKRFSSSEDIQTTINEILNIYYDLDLTATQ